MSQAGSFTPSALPPGMVVETLTGNTGGAIGPNIVDNINVVGDGTSITVAGNPGTNTLTISAIGEASSFPTDSGTATPITGVLNIISNVAANNAGSTVLFSGSSDTVLFNVTSALRNTMIGTGSGNASMSSQFNIGVGAFSGTSLTSGFSNVFIGDSAGLTITTGSGNILIGEAAGVNYTSSESYNIIFGSSSGQGGESNVLRMGSGTGTGAGELIQSFVSGILGITPDTADGIPVFIGSQGQLGTVGTGGSTLISSLTGNSGGAVGPSLGNINIVGDGTSVEVVGTPLTNTLTISAIGEASSFPTDSGTATPSAGVLTIEAGVSTQNSGSSVEFTGSGSTVTLNVTDSSFNTIIGLSAGNGSLSGADNTSVGKSSLTALTSGNHNTCIGYLSGTAITTGASNTFIGYESGDALMTGSNNIAIGASAGSSLATSDSTNTLIGHVGFATAADFIAITLGNGGDRVLHNYPGTNANTGNGGNLFVGQNAGNFTLTGATIFNNNGIGQQSLGSLTTGHLNNALGYNALNLLTTGNRNNVIGHEAGYLLVSGSYNVLLGNLSGSNYTTSESSNIQINNAGTVAESNVLRIGAATGSGNQQLNKAYICGIAGVNVGSVATVVTEASDQLGTAVITAGTGITVTPGANTITIATTALTAAITSITGDTGGAQTGPAITFAGGTTGLSFGGSANTLTTTFAGITANGGTVSLATDATTSTVNIGTGGGVKTVTVGSTNTSSSLALQSGTGNFSLASASGTTITALAAGEVTMPRQPAFEVRLANSLSNVTGDGTFYGIVFDTLVYDQGSNINLSGPPTTFTAPVTGIYNFSCCAFFTGLGALFTDARINLQTTTAGQIVMLRQNSANTNTSGFLVVNGNVYTKMNAGDTAFVQIYVGGSTKTIGLLGDASAFTTYFCGALIC